jgi:MFS family permease
VGIHCSATLTVVLGIGLSVLVPAVTTMALNSVEGKHSGLASAINNAFSQTAALLAIAVLGVLMFATFESNLDGRLMDLDLPSEARQQLDEEKINLAAVEVPEGLEAELTTTVERAVDEAFVSGYRVVMLAAATLALVSALSAALLIESKKKGARGASAEIMTFASSSRLDAEHPAEINKR